MTTVQATVQATTQATSKATPKGAQASKPAAPAAGVRFHMLQGFRPAAGAALYAHTAAFLALSGMDQGHPMPRARVAKVLGETAVKHHLNRTGFLAQDAQGVTVSDMGKDAFTLRTIDPELLAGFTDLLSKGSTTRNMPQTFTNPKGIKAL